MGTFVESRMNFVTGSAMMEQNRAELYVDDQVKGGTGGPGEAHVYRCGGRCCGWVACFLYGVCRVVLGLGWVGFGRTQARGSARSPPPPPGRRTLSGLWRRIGKTWRREEYSWATHRGFP